MDSVSLINKDLRRQYATSLDNISCQVPDLSLGLTLGDGGGTGVCVCVIKKREEKEENGEWVWGPTISEWIPKRLAFGNLVVNYVLLVKRDA